MAADASPPIQFAAAQNAKSEDARLSRAGPRLWSGRAPQTATKGSIGPFCYKDRFDDGKRCSCHASNTKRRQSNFLNGGANVFTAANADELRRLVPWNAIAAQPCLGAANERGAER